MKKAVIFLSILFLFILSSSILAQNSYWEKLVLNPLKNKNTKTYELPFSSEDVFRRIEQHQQQMIKMLSEGKSQKEIRNFSRPSDAAMGFGTISGTVYTTVDSLTPVKDALVLIDIYNEFGDYITSSPIDTNGYYKTVGLIPEIHYYVKASSGKYEGEYYNDALKWQDATLVYIPNAQDVTGIDFTLRRYTGGISGYVKTKDNQPILGVWIYVSNEFAYSECKTDSSGYYYAGPIPSGDYKVRTAYYGDENYEDFWYDNSFDQRHATLVHVTEPGITENINFLLGKAGAVTGQLFKPGGQPYYSPSAYVYIVNQDQEYVSLSPVDSSGKFFIKGITAGEYKLRVACPYQDNYMNLYYGGYSFEEAANITIIPPDTLRGINLNMEYGGTISGTFTDIYNQPVTQYTYLYLYDESGHETYMPQQRINNNYKYYSLLPGKYKIRITSEKYIPQWYNSKSSFEEADFIEVPVSDSVKNINFVLQPGAKIKGKVLYNGTPITSNGYIDAYDINHYRVRGGQIKEGSYIIYGLKPGVYKLAFDGSLDYASQWYNNKYTFETALEVELIDTSAYTADFNLNLSGKLKGFVKDPEGLGIDGSDNMTDVFMYDSAGTGLIQNSMLSFAGAYELYSLFGSYKFCAVTYNSFPSKDDSLAVTYYGGGASIFDPLSKTVNVPGTQIADDLVMQKAYGSISGTIYDNGNPLQDGLYELVAYDVFGFVSKISAYLNSDGPVPGTYKLTGLRPGSYYLVTGAKTLSNSTMFTLHWYPAVPQDIELFSPKMNIPAGALPVIVRSGETSGIDFYFNLTDNKDDNLLELSYSLEQNYPNPFNPNTKFKYSIPAQQLVLIKIYDILGNEIETLVNAEKPAGSYEINWNAVNMPSGVYFYQLKAGSSVQTRKMILLK